MKYTRCVMLAAAVVLCSPLAEAQVPQMLNYQGRVAVNGTNFDGAGSFKFAMVDAGVNISRPATGVAHRTGQFVTSVDVSDGGAGYVSAPGVSFSGGGGSGAAAHALIGGGAVTAIVVDVAGTGYTSDPGAMIGNPPVTMAYQTFWSNGASSVSLSVTKGLYAVLLGDTNVPNMAALSSAVFTAADVRLRVWFNGAQLVPDQRIASVAYALRAENADNLGGLSSTGYGLKGHSAFSNVLTVGSGAQYASITQALASITDNGPAKTYLIQVGPGTFAEQVNMKPYVEIAGSGEQVTTILNYGVTDFNTSGAVVAADHSAIRDLTIFCTNSLITSGNYATALFAANLGTNTFTARNITCKAFGGELATAIYCRYASPLLEHVQTESSGYHYSYGFYLYYSSATMNNISATVWGSLWYDDAIEIYYGAPHINTAIARTITGGTGGAWNWAVNMAGSSAVLNNVLASAEAAEGQNIGVFCNGGTPVLANCTIIGQGSSGENYGIYQFGTIALKVHTSQIKGATTCLYVSNGSCVTYAGDCQLDGPLITAAGGAITKVGCYNGSFVAIP